MQINAWRAENKKSAPTLHSRLFAQGTKVVKEEAIGIIRRNHYHVCASFSAGFAVNSQKKIDASANETVAVNEDEMTEGNRSWRIRQLFSGRTHAPTAGTSEDTSQQERPQTSRGRSYPNSNAQFNFVPSWKKPKFQRQRGWNHNESHLVQGHWAKVFVGDINEASWRANRRKKFEEELEDNFKPEKKAKKKQLNPNTIRHAMKKDRENYEQMLNPQNCPKLAKLIKKRVKGIAKKDRKREMKKQASRSSSSSNGCIEIE